MGGFLRRGVSIRDFAVDFLWPYWALAFLVVRRNVSLLKLASSRDSWSAFVEGTCRLVAASDQHSQTE